MKLIVSQVFNYYGIISLFENLFIVTFYVQVEFQVVMFESSNCISKSDI